MILLDTDHLTVFKYKLGDRGKLLRLRLDEAQLKGEVIGTTVIGLEEQMRGWLASIAKEKQPLRQIKPYQELVDLFGFFDQFVIVPFDVNAANLLSTMNRIKIRMSDRKAACITLATNSLLLTANRRDFEHVPGLRFENWLD